jgi:integrase
MSLSLELQRYLNVRRNLGYDLSASGRVLRRFVAFLEARNEAHIKTELFLEWRTSFGGANQSTWSRRLGMIRLFASWLHSLDPGHQVPPSYLIPGRYQRKKPFIYTDDQVSRMMLAAARLASANGFRAITYPAFIGLVSVTGLRISEAIALNDAHVDMDNGVIMVHNGKNGKDRLLPVSASTKASLKTYIAKRDRLLGYSPEPFFVSDAGLRLTDCAVRYNFAMTCQDIGLRAGQRFHKHGTGPRIHDLRHTFAVKVLMNWYRQGKDIDQEMLKLVNYLGHQKVAHTYWYIEAIPELMALASQRVQDYINGEARL